MRSEDHQGDATTQGTVLVTAFEPSGDAHAAPVIAEIRRRAPQVQVVAWGGPKMEAAGAMIIERSADDGAMGLSAISRIGAVRAHQAAIARWASAHRVNVHVPVDSPAANFPVALRMKARGVRVCHLVAPQLWAWAPWRIGKLRRATDCVLCLLPFEEKWFRDRQVPARFIGHPVINRSIAPDAATRAAELPPGAPKVLILPGSRSSEVRANLPVLMRVHADLQSRFRKMTSVLVAANEDLLALVRERLGGTLPSGLNLVVGQLDAAIAWSDLALCVSGTVSMDLTRQAKPMVAVYQVSPISWLGARMLLTTPHRLLPNILAGERIVPEFVPHMGGVAPISKAAELLLTDQKRMRASSDGLRRVLAMYQGRHPAREATDSILALLRGGNPMLTPDRAG